MKIDTLKKKTKKRRIAFLEVLPESLSFCLAIILLTIQSIKATVPFVWPKEHRRNQYRLYNYTQNNERMEL